MLFPLKYNPKMDLKGIEGDEGIPVSADRVAFNSKAPIKSRRTVGSWSGRLGKISVSREKDELEINEYNELKVAAAAITAYNLLVGTAETDTAIKALHGKWSSVGTNVAQFNTGLLSGLYTPGAVNTSGVETKVESNGAIYRRQVSSRAGTVYSFSGGVRSTVATYTRITSQGAWTFVGQNEPLMPAQPPYDVTLRG